MLKKINVYKLLVGGGLTLLAASAALADDTDSRITTYKNNGLLPANYEAPTLSTVDSGDIVEFSPAALSWVSNDVASAQAAAYREQFASFYDITRQDWMDSGNDAMFASLDGLKFLGLVENGIITDAAINASEAAEIAGSTAWYCASDISGADLSDVRYWTSACIDFYNCTFGDNVPGDYCYYEGCSFANVIPTGAIVDCTFNDGAVASEGTIIGGDYVNGEIPSNITTIANPEVVSIHSTDLADFTFEQISRFKRVSDCTLPPNVDLTYEEATSWGVIAGTNHLGENSYVIADENCNNLHANVFLYKDVSTSMLDQSKTHVSDWEDGSGARLRPEQYAALYPLIRADILAHRDDPEWWPVLYFTDGSSIGGSEWCLE